MHIKRMFNRDMPQEPLKIYENFKTPEKWDLVGPGWDPDGPGGTDGTRLNPDETCVANMEPANPDWRPGSQQSAVPGSVKSPGQADADTNPGAPAPLHGLGAWQGLFGRGLRTHHRNYKEQICVRKQCRAATQRLDGQIQLQIVARHCCTSLKHNAHHRANVSDSAKLVVTAPLFASRGSSPGPAFHS